jgi:hypothetical protein
MRRCARCKTEKPTIEFRSYMSAVRSLRTDSYCIKCRREYNIERNARKRAGLPPPKRGHLPVPRDDAAKALVVLSELEMRRGKAKGWWYVYVRGTDVVVGRFKAGATKYARALSYVFDKQHRRARVRAAQPQGMTVDD